MRVEAGTIIRVQPFFHIFFERLKNPDPEMDSNLNSCFRKIEQFSVNLALKFEKVRQQNLNIQFSLFYLNRTQESQHKQEQEIVSSKL
jgi:hypothetical protein